MTEGLFAYRSDIKCPRFEKNTNTSELKFNSPCIDFQAKKKNKTYTVIGVCNSYRSIANE